RGRRRLVQQERNSDIASPAQALGVEPLGLTPVGAAIDHIINHGVEIKLFAIQLVEHARQILGFQQLKLMTNRRDHAFVSLARLLDECLVAALHAFLNHAAPADAVVSKLAIPLVVVESNLALFQNLLGSLGFEPAFSAVDFVRFAFSVWIVPGAEKIA